MIRHYSTLTVEPAHSSPILIYVSAFLYHFSRSTSVICTAPPIPPPELNETTSLSPPFALAISISSTGVIACATASGDVYIGYGGSKTSNSTKRKKARNWKGLKSDESIWFKAAEGAVVSVYVILLASRIPMNNVSQSLRSRGSFTTVHAITQWKGRVLFYSHGSNLEYVSIMCLDHGVTKDRQSYHYGRSRFSSAELWSRE